MGQGMNRPVIKDSTGLEFCAGQGYGNTDNPGLVAGSLATVGAGTLTNSILDAQIIYRTGPTGAFTDTIDTVVNIDAGIGKGMDPGDCLTIDYSNQVAYVATIAGVTGITLTSTKTTIAASSYGKLVLRKITSAVYGTTITNGVSSTTVTTNGSYALYVL